MSKKNILTLSALFLLVGGFMNEANANVKITNKTGFSGPALTITLYIKGYYDHPLPFKIHNNKNIVIDIPDSMEKTISNESLIISMKFLNKPLAVCTISDKDAILELDANDKPGGLPAKCHIKK